MNPLIVSTECPECGAPLDFTEGSNAVRCGHCRSNLLVTGRGQILSYSVSPRFDEHRAVALAVKAWRDKGMGEFRNVKPRLYFIPYYRMTGQDFGWEKPAPKPPTGDSDDAAWTDLDDTWAEKRHDFMTFNDISFSGAAAELMKSAIDHFFRRRETMPDGGRDIPAAEGNRIDAGEKVPGDRDAGVLYEKGEVLLNDRYVEKNFLACNLAGIGIYSLGVRPSVLKLELFRKETLTARGSIVNPSVSPDDAEAVGMKTALNPSLLYRQVIGKVLSIIYFPFWVIETECDGKVLSCLIDGVSQTVVRAEAPPSIYGILNGEFRDRPTVVGFRALTCPNCGWDFPVRPDDIIFFCRTCKSAWQVRRGEMSRIGFEVAGGLPAGTVSGRYLPFWVLRRDNEGKPSRFFIPAFRYRRLKFLLDLALVISKLQPPYQVADSKDLDLAGCYYDASDAELLAHFTQKVLRSRSTEEMKTCGGGDPSFAAATLTWFPFREEGTYLISPFGGTGILKALLL